MTLPISSSISNSCSVDVVAAEIDKRLLIPDLARIVAGYVSDLSCIEEVLQKLQGAVPYFTREIPPIPECFQQLEQGERLFLMSRDLRCIEWSHEMYHDLYGCDHPMALFQKRYPDSLFTIMTTHCQPASKLEPTHWIVIRNIDACSPEDADTRIQALATSRLLPYKLANVRQAVTAILLHKIATHENLCTKVRATGVVRPMTVGIGVDQLIISDDLKPSGTSPALACASSLDLPQNDQ